MRGKVIPIRWLLCVLLLLVVARTAAAGGVIYVDADAAGANNGSSWENAYVSLQDALADAETADKPVEIHVAQGIYTPDHGFRQSPGGSYAYFRLINEVAIKGSFAGFSEADPNARDVELYNTILSGDLKGNDAEVKDPCDLYGPTRADNCRNVVVCSNTDVTAVLDGLTITGGHSTMVLIEGLAGGAGMIIHSASPTLIDCVFTGNFANQAGGGLRNSGGSPILINCTFSKNRGGRGGGMINYDEGSPTLINCIFHNNTSNSHGAGMYNHNCSPRLTNCKFSENSANYGGGIYNVISKPVLSNCTFIRNWGNSYGGGICNWHECSPRITDCVFNENSSNSGGAIYNNRNSNPTLTNCIFSRNFSDSEGGAIYNLDNCNPTITNCIISSNQAKLAGGGIYNSNSNPIINNCDFRGNYGGSAGGGIHNRNSNPILTNCIFTGNSATDRIGFWYMKASGGGMGNYENSHPILTNCTFAGNLGYKGRALACNSWLQKSPSIIEITNCIFRDGEDEISNDDNSTIIINYSNIQGGGPEETNIDVDPLFVNPGYWDPNSTPDDPNDDFWIDGDYHLKSQAGRWDPVSQIWVVDDVTSPCIDAGDPNSPVAFEPFPNGGIINMGAYGGTTGAGKSPSGIHAKYGGGSGTSNDPYLIYTAEQINAIGANLDDWDKHFKLMADIDLSGYTGKSFNIIGNGDSSFTGIFDGNGHTISNFSYTSSNGHFIGLFRHIFGRNAQIKDLGLIAPNVNAGTGRDVGTLAGQVISGTIMNCYVEGGSVAGDERIGGLVGSNFGNLKDCSSTCNVSGDEQVGGLVGYNFDEITNCYAGGEIFGRQDVGGLTGSSQGTIKNSSAAGNVGGGGDYVGGLVGSNSGLLLSCSSGGEVYGDVQVGGLVGNSDDPIVDCYATGDISGTENVGGLVGRTYGSIINCYAIGSVSGVTNVGGLVGQGLENYIAYGRAINSFWDIETSGQLTSDGGTGKTTAQMQDPNTFMDAGWNFVGASDGPSDIWVEPEGGGCPVLWWQLTPLPQLPAFSGGTGEPDDPYLISTADELNSIGHNPRLMSAHFQLINHIDLAGVDFFIIGDQWYPFSGTFDGNVRTISNFSYTSPEATGVGLFGYVFGCQIKDLGLIDSYISIDRGLFHGSLVGYLEGGAITNCYVEAGNISGNDYIGGLVGISNGDLNSSGTITNCYVTGSVTGDDNVGGLVGSNNAAVAECYVTGSVGGDDDVGGLVGSNAAPITDCYAIADVNGSERVGGLVGAGNYISFGHGGIRSRIEKCYAAGRVSGDEDVGGLVGQNTGEIALSFWDTETSGQSTSDGGEGKTTAVMQSAVTFLDAGWDFVDETENGTEDVWWILEGQGYPRLWWEYAENGE